jgi:hypothetical protein
MASDPVGAYRLAQPRRPGLTFDSACTPVASAGVVTTTGFFDGRSSWISGPFTLAAAGPVGASAAVTSDYGLALPMHLALLGYYPGGGRDACSAQWLSEPIAPGPSMSLPTITARWDLVPPGTYCLDVAAPQGTYPPPYSWTATVTLP